MDSRDEIQSVILDVLNIKDRSQRRILVELWREGDADETARLQRKASGTAPEDLESPLGEGVAEGLHDKFARSYGYKLQFSDQLAESLLGRIKHEIDRKTHTLIQVDRVRSARDVSRPVKPKHVQLGGNIDLVVSGAGATRRDIRDVHDYMRSLEMLLVSGHVVVGNIWKLLPSRQNRFLRQPWGCKGIHVLHHAEDSSVVP